MYERAAAARSTAALTAIDVWVCGGYYYRGYGRKREQYYIFKTVIIVLFEQRMDVKERYNRKAERPLFSDVQIIVRRV